jgi:hypothetical protein
MAAERALTSEAYQGARVIPGLQGARVHVSAALIWLKPQVVECFAGDLSPEEQKHRFMKPTPHQRLAYSEQWPKALTWNATAAMSLCFHCPNSCSTLLGVLG